MSDGTIDAQPWREFLRRAFAFLLPSWLLLGIGFGMVWLAFDGKPYLPRLLEAYLYGCGSWTFAWGVGYAAPLLPPRAGPASLRARVWCVVGVLVLGWSLPLVGLVIGHLFLLNIKALMQFLVITGATIGAGTALGATVRGWPRLSAAERARMALALQWTVWPLIAPDLLRLGAALVGATRSQLGPLLNAHLSFAPSVTVEFLVRAATAVCGVFSVSRISRLGLIAAVVGLLFFWTIVVAWLAWRLTLA